MSEKETHQKQRKHTKAEEHVSWRFGVRERERFWEVKRLNGLREIEKSESEIALTL